MEFVETSTSDGLILQGLISEPSNSTEEVILHIHGMAGNFWENAFVKEMLNRYPKNNVAFLTAENRGSEMLRWFKKKDEGFRLIGNAHELFEDSPLDIQAWISFLKSRGYQKIHLQGHSLGCAKIAYYKKSSKDNSIKSLIFISPSDMIGLLVNPKDLPDYQQHLKEAHDLVSQGKENQLVSGMPRGFAMQSAKSYINFSKENKNMAIFNYYNPELGFDTLKAIDVPILAITGTEDVGIPIDKEAALTMIKKEAVNSPNVVGKVLDGAEHDFDGFEKEIVDSVLEFLRK